jgi:hypothetical protein
LRTKQFQFKGNTAKAQMVVVYDPRIMSGSVNEATIALKGLLGIHPNSPSIKAGDESKIKNNEPKNGPPPDKKKNKKSSNNTNTKVNKNDSVHTQHTAALEIKSKVLKGGQGSSERKKKKKDATKTVTSKTTENFALSAFQSPPDPSTLPLPSFQGLDDDIGIKPIPGGEKDHLESIEKDQTIESTSMSLSNSTGQVKALLSIPTPSISESTTQISSLDEKRIKGDNQSKENVSDINLKGDDVETGKRMSQSGVNLALLAMKGNENISITTKLDVDHRPHTMDLDPIAVLLKGESYGIANPALAHSQSTNPQQWQSFGQPYGYMPPYDRFTPIPFHPMYQPPPPFTTIQVQVPPVLLPGNQMILPASPLTGGYPMPITLPENAQPGMIVPVTIPHMASPPYPLHFMNMNVTSPHVGMVSNPSQNYYTHNAQHTYQHVDNHTVDPYGRGESKTKSWAERVTDPSKQSDHVKKAPK